MSGELFELSSALVLFEYFRVPSRVTERQPPVGLPDACSWVRSTESGRLLLWPSDAFLAPASERLGPVTYCLRSMELYGRVVPDSRASDLLDASWTLDRMFTRFARTAEARTARIPGIGLGLYISKGLVEAHGGRIWVRSEHGTTTFRFNPKRCPAGAAGGGVSAIR